MIYVLLAKGVSVISVLAQIWVLANFLSTGEIAEVYYYLAQSAGYAVLACSIPNFIAIHASSGLKQSNLLKEMRHATLLAIVSTVVCFSLFALVGIATALFRVNYLSALAAALAVFSSLPTIVANNLFSRAFIKSGSLLIVANVLIPQASGGVAVAFHGTAFSWFSAVLLGHLIVNFLAFKVWWGCRKDSVSNGMEILPITLDFQIIVSIFIPLVMMWFISQYPRLVLKDVGQTEVVASVFILATLAASASNAYETVILQWRRSTWMKYAGGSYSALDVANFLKFEFGKIAWLGLVSLAVSALALPLISHFLAESLINLPYITILLIIIAEFSRAALSLTYSVGDALRRQKKMMPSMALILIFVIFVGQIFSGAIEGLYGSMALVLIAGAVFIARISLFRNERIFRDYE